MQLQYSQPFPETDTTQSPLLSSESSMAPDTSTHTEQGTTDRNLPLPTPNHEIEENSEETIEPEIKQNFKIVDKRKDNKFEIDYARILYSSSFRRLQGKMQMLGIDSANFHRNRLTHSLEVAQIARSISAHEKVIP